MGRGLRDKLVLITGASAGIGRAAAHEFIRRGARVIAVARSRDRLDALAEELGGPPRLLPIVADVADAASMQAMVSRVLNEIDVPDVVVANAGIGLDALFTETTDELLRDVFEVNVFGLIRTIRPFVPGMTERGGGRILMISSVVGKRGIPHYSAYSASKFALQGLAESLRTELRGTGVTVGVIYPSTTESEFHAKRLRRGPAQSSTRVTRASADSVARVIARMATSRRRERILSPEGKLMNLANKFVPGLLDVVLGWVLGRRHASGVTRPEARD